MRRHAPGTTGGMLLALLLLPALAAGRGAAAPPRRALLAPRDSAAAKAATPSTARGVNAAYGAALGTPVCLWEDSDNLCVPTQDNWLVPAGQPSSPYRRSNLMAIARHRVCMDHASEADCWKDAAHRCYWYAERGKAKGKDKAQSVECRSADLVELWWFSATGFSAAVFDVPVAMTCPGTKAHEFFSCFAHPAGIEGCNRLPACFAAHGKAAPNLGPRPAQGPTPTGVKAESLSHGSVSAVASSSTRAQAAQGGAAAQANATTSMCLPKFMQRLGAKEVGAFVAALRELAPSVFGDCAGACWLRRAKHCRTLKEVDPCNEKDYCAFDKAANMCFHKSMEIESNFDHRVRRLYGACLEIDNAADCKATERIVPSPTIDWRAYNPATQPVKCQL